jgi:tetratricopeptide (TPR) repeat protein
MSYNRIKAANPKIVVSAATICFGGAPSDFTKPSAYSSVCQDWKMWMEQGMLDINIPMNYKPEDKYAKAFRLWADSSGKWSGADKTYQGLDAEHQTAEQLIAQIKYCRSIGQKGFLLFPFNAGKLREGILPAFQKEFSPAPRLPVNELDAKDESRRVYDKGIELAVAWKIEEAIAQFKKAIELDPLYSDAHFRLGRCYLKVKDYPAAKTYFLKTLELDPNYKEAQKELDLLAMQKN